MVLGVGNRHSRGVSICGSRLLVICLAIAAVTGVLALRSASADARRDQQPCLWGASSVSAEKVNGKVVVSPVATSGCIPK